MAKKLRSINTRIWDDAWFTELTPDEKLIWIYLITNPLTNLIGIYEIPLKRVAFDTGIGIEKVRKAFESFQRSKKALFVDSHIMLVNFYGNQSMNTNMEKGARANFEDLPENVKNEALNNPLKGFETLRNGLGMVRKYEYEYKDELEDEVKSEKEIEVKSEKEKKDLEWPFDSDDFKTLWTHWKEYKAKEHGFKYKSIQGEQAALMKIGNLAKNLDHAKAIIMQSMENGWKGFFEIKNNNHNGTKTGNNSRGGTGAGFDLKKAFAYIDEMYERREAGSDGNSTGGEDFFDC